MALQCKPPRVAPRMPVAHRRPGHAADKTITNRMARRKPGIDRLSMRGPEGRRSQGTICIGFQDTAGLRSFRRRGRRRLSRPLQAGRIAVARTSPGERSRPTGLLPPRRCGLASVGLPLFAGGPVGCGLGGPLGCEFDPPVGSGFGAPVGCEVGAPVSGVAEAPGWATDAQKVATLAAPPAAFSRLRTRP